MQTIVCGATYRFVPENGRLEDLGVDVDAGDVALDDEALGGEGRLGCFVGLAVDVFAEGFGLNRELNLARAFALAADIPPAATAGTGAGALQL